MEPVVSALHSLGSLALCMDRNERSSYNSNNSSGDFCCCGDDGGLVVLVAVVVIVIVVVVVVRVVVVVVVVVHVFKHLCGFVFDYSKTGEYVSIYSFG